MDTQLLNKMTSWISWTKSDHHKQSKSEEEEDKTEDNHNLLLSLLFPDVTNILLDHLDLKSLLNLRLSCKTTKTWVDQARYLSRLRITLHSSLGHKKMKKVLKSKTNFNSFRLAYEKRVSEDLLHEFALRFGPYLKVLELNNTLINFGVVINLLKECSGIESLTLLSMNLTKVPPLPLLSPIGGPGGHQEDQETLKNLSNLKYLSIGTLLFLNEQELEYFKVFLLLCAANLRSLRLPYVNFQSKKEKGQRNAILGKYLIDPVIQSMQKRGGQCSKNGNLRHLILEFLNPALPQDLFIKLAQVCYKFGTILHNVHESHFKGVEGQGGQGPSQGHGSGQAGQGSHSRVEDQGMEKAQEIIGSLDGLNQNVKLSKLINLTCISIWVSSALCLTEDNYSAPSLPRLQSVNLFIDTATVEDDGGRIARLVGAVLETPRPTVTSLKISYNSRRGGVCADLVRARDITRNFQYLRKLDIYQWDAFDEDFLEIWNGPGASRLVELNLLLCTNLSDRGLLGNDFKNPALLKLTGLKELHISSLYGSITDASIQRAFRLIPLNKFRLYSQSVTFDGIASLLDGVFHTKIEYVHCSKPLDCTQKEFYYLVKDILNAKSCTDFHKKKHLRRRSQPLVYLEPPSTTEDD